MKKMVRTTTVVLLACLMIFTIAGCKKEAASQASAAPRVKGELPLVDQKTTMSVFLGEGGGANLVGSYTYADNVFTKRVTDETNIEFEFTIGSQVNKREQLNVLLNAGNYPEVIITDTLSYGEMVYYAGQGILRSIDEYDPLSYPRIKAAFDEFPGLNQISRSNDGKLYTLPAINDCLHCIYSGGRMWMYWPWAQEHNKKMPDNPTEFLEYLRWVKQTDLNKNGQHDEIPMAFEAQRQQDYFFAGMAKMYMPFVFSGNGAYVGIAVENNKVVEQYKDSRFRDSLKFIAQIYNEGLLLPDSFSLTQDQMRALMSADTPVIAVSGSPWIHHHMVMPSQRFYEFFEIRAMEAPDGKRYSTNQDPWSIMRGCYYITDKAKDPELAVALYDYFIRFDVSMDSYIGPKGKAWVDAVPGTKSFLDLPASYRFLVPYGSQPFNTQWDQAAPMIRNMTFRGGEEATDVPVMVDYIQNRNLSLIETLIPNMSFNEGFWYLTTRENIPNAMPDSMFVPPIAFSDEDSTRIADINAVLVEYKRQVWVEFVTGKRDINNDSEWNNYLAELDRNGSAEMAQLIQKYIK